MDEQIVKEQIKFTKEQILESKQYTNIEKDILKTLLQDNSYSLSEVNELLINFLDKEVK